MLRSRWLWLAGVAISTLIQAGLAIQLPLMTTLRDLLPATTPGMELYEPARERFGGDEAAYVALEADDHFTKVGLERIARLTRALEDHPFIERVVSPTNAQQMWLDEDDTLVVDTFVRDEVAPKDVLEAMTTDESFQGALVSDDGRFVLLVAQAVPSTTLAASLPRIEAEIAKRTAHLPVLLTEREDPETPRRLLELSKQTLGSEIVTLAEETGYDGDRIHAVGFTPLLSLLLAEAEKNLTRLFPLTVLAIFLTLVLLLRRPLDTILPLLCVGPAVVWAVAVGGLVFGRITLISTVAPVIVLVVGVSDVVHLVTQYRHELHRGHPRDEAIRLSFRHVGAACTLTSLTTLIGFGSMIWLPLPTARELGVTAGIGVVAAFLLSFVLTPILLSFTTPSDADRRPEPRSDVVARFLVFLGGLVGPRPRVVAALGLGLTVITIGALLERRVENSLTRKLRPGHPMRISVKTVEEHLGASADVEVLVDTGVVDGMKDPAVIRGLAALRDRIETVPFVTNTISVVDLLEQMHGLLAPDLASKDPIPADSRAQIAQYFLLFEVSGGKELQTLVDPTYRHSRMVLRGLDGTAEELLAAVEDYNKWAKELMPASTSSEANGIGLLAARLGPAILESTVQGFSMALLLIAVMLAFLFRSVRVGALSLIPNLLPVAAALVMVPVVFEQIDVDTLMFVPVCVGIAVDDTIHFLARFRIERTKGLDRPAAVQATIAEAGHGIVRTSLVLIAGFFLLLIADYQPVATVGLLLPVTLVVAVIADLTFVPAMAQLGWLDSNG